MYFLLVLLHKLTFCCNYFNHPKWSHQLFSLPIKSGVFSVFRSSPCPCGSPSELFSNLRQPHAWINFDTRCSRRDGGPGMTQRDAVLLILCVGGGVAGRGGGGVGSCIAMETSCNIQWRERRSDGLAGNKKQQWKNQKSFQCWNAHFKGLSGEKKKCFLLIRSSGTRWNLFRNCNLIFLYCVFLWFCT